MMDPYTLPDDLPCPVDDGAANHLAGTRVPAIALGATDGTAVDLSSLSGRTIVYAYPWTGRPGQPLLIDDTRSSRRTPTRPRCSAIWSRARQRAASREHAGALGAGVKAAPLGVVH
jgi:peroxiredoxin